MAQLWGGRFTKETDQLVYNFNASISFDQKFYAQDIKGSMAHVKMLAKQGILTEEDKEQIQNNEYIRLLGFNSKAQEHINKIKKDINLPIVTKYTSVESKIKDYELKAASIYKLITNDDVLSFELSNKPIKR